MFKHELREFKEPTVVTTKEGRKYSLGGNSFPSVTTVLGEYGKEGILAWRERVGAAEANRISAYASSRGTKLHAACEKFLMNDPTYTKMDPITAELFKKLKQPLIDNVRCVYAIECPLVSNYLGVGGRVDAVVNWNGVDSILDYKSSDKIKKEEYLQSYFWQTAIYAVMYEEITKRPISQIVIAMSPEEPGPAEFFIRKRNDYIHPAMERIKEYYERHRP